MDRVIIKFPRALLAAIDKMAAASKEPRSFWIRRVLSRAARTKYEPVKRGRPVVEKS